MNIHNTNLRTTIQIAPSQLSLDGTRCEVIQDWRPRDRYRRKTSRTTSLRFYKMERIGRFEVERQCQTIPAHQSK